VSLHSRFLATACSSQFLVESGQQLAARPAVVFERKRDLVGTIHSEVMEHLRLTLSAISPNLFAKYVAVSRCRPPAAHTNDGVAAGALPSSYKHGWRMGAGASRSWRPSTT